MATIRVERTIPAPIEAVFDVISDHAGYSRFPGIQSAQLIREGDIEQNGVDALRRIRSRPLLFEEEITGFDRPHRMDYLIVEVNAPMKHHGGSMVLSEQGSGTNVVWTSTIEFTVPVIGGVLGAIAAWITSLGFRRVLDEAGRLAAGSAASAAVTSA